MATASPLLTAEHGLQRACCSRAPLLPAHGSGLSHGSLRPALTARQKELLCQADPWIALSSSHAEAGSVPSDPPSRGWQILAPAYWSWALSTSIPPVPSLGWVT